MSRQNLVIAEKHATERILRNVGYDCLIKWFTQHVCQGYPISSAVIPMSSLPSYIIGRNPKLSRLYYVIDTVPNQRYHSISSTVILYHRAYLISLAVIRYHRGHPIPLPKCAVKGWSEGKEDSVRYSGKGGGCSGSPNGFDIA